MAFIHLTTRELLKVFMGKAPVCVCGPMRSHCMMDAPGCGPQRQAHRVQTILESRGVVFPDGMGTALGHALIVGEGRGEFDRVMAAWLATTPGLDWPG